MVQGAAGWWTPGPAIAGLVIAARGSALISGVRPQAEGRSPWGMPGGTPEGRVRAGGGVAPKRRRGLSDWYCCVGWSYPQNEAANYRFRFIGFVTGNLYRFRGGLI